MSEERQPCFVCRAGAAFEACSTLHLCMACALRVADLAANASESFWASVATSTSPDGATLDRQTSREPLDSEQAFEAFKDGVAKHISKDDADSHLHLATAYFSMGLYLDARREASLAITPSSATGTSNAALRLLLTAPLLPDNALSRLRERLQRSVH